MKMTDLIEGRMITRYKRFFADCEVDGETVTAHTPNTGSMKTCWEEGWPVLLSKSDNPKRKLKFTLEMTHNGATWIGVNTQLPNKLVKEAIEEGKIPELVGFDSIKPEAKVGDSRIDLLMMFGEQRCWVEVKNVTLLGEGTTCEFPDSVSTRGQKHLRELTELKKKGDRACMFFLVQREDVDLFRPAAAIDPEYARLLKEASSAGVEILVYQCSLGPEGVEVVKRLNFEL